MTAASSNKTRSSSSVSGTETAGVINNDADGDGFYIGKRDSEDNAWSSSNYQYINPFVHNLLIDSSIDLAKVYVLTVLLLPIRIVGCVISLISAWMFACIGLCGLSQDELKAKPLSGWRKCVQTLANISMRMLYASGSFHYISFKGLPKASPKVAPVLVVAPHSSYVDSLVVVATGPPSIVAKQETSDIPLLGKIINFAQPIYVQREDPNSRQNTIREIVRRARSSDDWPQVMLFPEGTCTNRNALIKFKPGAFYPGVPVQPVLLKYPNKYDTFTWTWDGPGVFKLLWLTMSQFYSKCEVEFLPVYNPSEAEKQDANLYAKNVREVMAKALNVPTSEYSFEDVIMMTRAKDMKIPFPGDIVEIEQILQNLGIIHSNRDLELASEFLQIFNSDKLDVITFAELLQIDIKNTKTHDLFALFVHNHKGYVCLKSVLLCSLFCKNVNDELIKFLRRIVHLYSESMLKISRESFRKLMRHSKLSPEKCDALFLAIDVTNKGHISFDDFENHTKNLSQYNFLFKKQEIIRRHYEK